LAARQGNQFSPAGEDVLAFCRANGIAFMGYSPLHAWPFKLSPLADRHVAAVAARTFHTPAQVLLRWALQRGGGVVTRSSHPTHIAHAAKVFDFSLSAQVRERPAQRL
jgi:diketogulonate reductase-like aldo/keto reductase